MLSIVFGLVCVFVVVLHLLLLLLYVFAVFPLRGGWWETREEQSVFAHITAELPRRLFHPLLSFSVLSPFSPSHFTFALYVCIFIYICIYVDLLYIHIYSKSSLARYSRKKPVKAK